MFQERLEALFKVVDGADSISILTHNNPDPDAIASAIALQFLLIEKIGLGSQIFYQGIVGRAENRALVRYLDYPLKYLVEKSDLYSGARIALVDTQPGAGNNALPDDLTPLIIIDHHPWRDTSAQAPFVDVRADVGSVSTMVTQYLMAADIIPSTRLATALFYGIKTDTLGLERGTSSADRDAFCYLLPLVDIEALFEIERAQVPVHYFKNFATALQGTYIYKNLVVSYIGLMNYPDLVAEMADFLLRMEGCSWVLCIGVYQNQLYLSVRSRYQQGAGKLVQEIVGSAGLAGGHGAMAGGQMALDGQNPEQLAQTLKQRALQYLGLDTNTPGESLI